MNWRGLVAINQGNWKLEFQYALEQNSLKSMIQVLDSQATKHAGTAPAKIKYAAAKALQKLDLDELYPLVLAMCRHESPTAQEVGCLCIPEFYPQNEHEVTETLYSLADSQNWEVREWAAGSSGEILMNNFETYFPVMVNWTQDDSENVRRAAVLAMMGAGGRQNCNEVVFMLECLGPLLSDPSRYVRDNLGPFAIGAGLLKSCPSEVLQWLRKWSESENEQVRWNVAMAFTTAAAANVSTEAASILALFSGDERLYVKRAVAKAQKNLENRRKP
ncbi:HEAT repeat domain-containing protein [Alicyclobacillus sp. SO9]|uniref:HEAT repeat domain-containing protein n=1 Tax=Alicyclobacillus sp. SO9 TaxID=2665646 RepID=UPI0018E8C601|nr:HEAT repeat domain-containing protein [Alicyclobacillus sp. SO9]QQE78105.1 HEAT repeat domain-containing protein [Alicyclobacillus sp. SO9]